MKININDVFCLVIDIQERLLPHMKDYERFLSNTNTLLKGLQALNVEIIINEQYKKGLGETVNTIRELLPNNFYYEKTTFSALENNDFVAKVTGLNKKYALVCGIEAHVCVMQSCLDLLKHGITPILVVDCISSRKELDKEIALKRLERENIIFTTYESILFELLVDAKNPSFKTISALIK